MAECDLIRHSPEYPCWRLRAQQALDLEPGRMMDFWPKILLLRDNRNMTMPLKRFSAIGPYIYSGAPSGACWS